MRRTKWEKELKEKDREILKGYMDCKKEWLAGKSIKELMVLQGNWEDDNSKSESYIAGWSHSIYDRCDDDGWEERTYIALYCNYPNISKIEDLTINDGIRAIEKQLFSEYKNNKRTIEELITIGDSIPASLFKIGWNWRLNYQKNNNIPVRITPTNNVSKDILEFLLENNYPIDYYYNIIVNNKNNDNYAKKLANEIIKYRIVRYHNKSKELYNG